MPQVDFSSLYKFVASIGVAMLIAAVAVPWLLAQSVGVLTVSEETIDGLPRTAGEAILRRQASIVWVQDTLTVPILIGFAVLGVGLLAWALWKWVPAQKRVDIGEQIALDKSRAEYTLMNGTEIDQKRQAEATDETLVDRESRGGLLAGAEQSPTGDGVAHHRLQMQTPYGAARADLGRPLKEVVSELAATEAQVTELVKSAFESAFEVAKDVRMTSGSARGRTLDLLLEPKSDGRAQLGLEIRKFSGQLLPSRLSDLMTQVAVSTQDLSPGKVFTGVRGRPPEAKASGVLFLVLKGNDYQSNVLRISGHVPVINAAFRRGVGVVVVSEERLNAVEAADIRAAVASVWTEPDQVVEL